MGVDEVASVGGTFGGGGDTYTLSSSMMGSSMASDESHDQTMEPGIAAIRAQQLGFKQADDQESNDDRGALERMTTGHLNSAMDRIFNDSEVPPPPPPSTAAKGMFGGALPPRPA